MADCSSSIGTALAKQYAGQGAHLWLVTASSEALDLLRKACLALGAPSVTVVTADPWTNSGWIAVHDALKHGGLQLLPEITRRSTTPPLKSSLPSSASKSMPVPLRSASLSRSSHPKAPARAPSTVPATSSQPPQRPIKRLAPTPPSTPPPLRRSSRAAFTPQPVVKAVPSTHTSSSSVSSKSSLRSSLSGSPFQASQASTLDSKNRRVKHGSCSDESIGSGSLDLLVLVTGTPNLNYDENYDSHLLPRPTTPSSNTGSTTIGKYDARRNLSASFSNSLSDDTSPETPSRPPDNVQCELTAAQQLLQVHYLVST